MSNSVEITPTSIDEKYYDYIYEAMVSRFEKVIKSLKDDFTTDEVKLAFEEAVYNLTQKEKN